jgi:hypothetical protein
MSKFTTVIPAMGPDGNVFVVLANAVSLMRRLNVDPNEVHALRQTVLDAKSYDEAIAAVREWFPVDTGEEP